METIENIMALVGAAEIDSRLEEQLIDGILYAFQEQTQEVYFDFFNFKINFLRILLCLKVLAQSAKL